MPICVIQNRDALLTRRRTSKKSQHLTDRERIEGTSSQLWEDAGWDCFVITVQVGRGFQFVLNLAYRPGDCRTQLAQRDLIPFGGKKMPRTKNGQSDPGRGILCIVMPPCVFDPK